MLNMHHLLKMAEDCQNAAPSSLQVSPRIPILYFGDFERFRESRLRIVTVALNPSLSEFPTASPFQRFPSLCGYSRYNGNVLGLQQAYNDYFKVDPYMRWFNHFEKVLNGFDASFFCSNDYENTALHTDLLSPVATNPTWSKLNDNDKNSMSKSGLDLWHSLINFLNPDVLIVSVARKYFDQIRFLRSQQSVEIFSVQGKGRKRVTVCSMEISKKKRVNVIYAIPAQVPFGYLSHIEKKDVGACFSAHVPNYSIAVKSKLHGEP